MKKKKPSELLIIQELLINLEDSWTHQKIHYLPLYTKYDYKFHMLKQKLPKFHNLLLTMILEKNNKYITIKLSFRKFINSFESPKNCFCLMRMIYRSYNNFCLKVF